MQKEKNDMAFISQKQIADKANNSLSEFIVFSNHDFTKQDWVIKSKFLEISNLLGTTPLEYPLKKMKGNVDEGQKAIDGKALRIIVEEELVSIAVYTKSYGKSWSLSHTHHIDKNIFDAYALAVKNDQAVSKLEQESKTPKNFSLDLS